MTILEFAKRAAAALQRAAWIFPTLARLTLGWLFATTGWGKIHSLDKVTVFFSDLGIPAPGFHAVLVGYSELLCGVLLLCGLFTRLACVPLLTSMVVALLTAKRSEIGSLTDLFGLVEFTYLVLLVGLIFSGAGPLALDAWLWKKLGIRARGPVVIEKPTPVQA